jgi:hypothetical protein
MHLFTSYIYIQYSNTTNMAFYICTLATHPSGNSQEPIQYKTYHHIMRITHSILTIRGTSHHLVPLRSSNHPARKKKKETHACIVCLKVLKSNRVQIINKADIQQQRGRATFGSCSLPLCSRGSVIKSCTGACTTEP